jgi:SAM-dependent methyltransferase/DNA-directed RNA polymerase subunit RPC12/RpoP
MIRKSDYENYDYRQFWQDNKRAYEDRAERIAIRKFLKDIVNREEKVIADLGCGFGRLFGEYADFRMILLVDYSLNNLRNARKNIDAYLRETEKRHLSDRVFFIAADVNNLPLKSDTCDICMTVRLIHHLPDPGNFFTEVKKVIKKDGIFILEFANKRNFKNILKFAVGRLKESPFDSKPLQIGDTILDQHPGHIKSLLKKLDFKIIRQISASNFRLGFLKRKVNLKFLLFVENIYQNLFSFINTGPSIFLKTRLCRKNDGEKVMGDKEKSDSAFDTKNRILAGKEISNKLPVIFLCPKCKNDSLVFSDIQSGAIRCTNCDSRFLFKDGIYDFKL